MIPARMGARRLPGKPLALIGGLPMIAQVMRRAIETGLGPVVIACAENEIAEAVKKAGGEAVLTDPKLATGSDRIYAALQTYDPGGKFDAIINVQGDVPTIDPAIIRKTFALLENPRVDIATAVAPVTDAGKKASPHIVKAVMEIKEGETSGRALDFTRSPARSGDGPVYGHIGLYAYRRAALETFVQSPQSAREKRESLEQLRALDIGLRMEAVLVDSFPLGVDTPEDLEKAQKELEARGKGQEAKNEGAKTKKWQ